MNDSWLNSFRQLWKNKTYIAFVGTGRVGTNFFASFFDSVLDECISVHEPRPDAFDLAMNYVRKKPNISETAQEYVRIRSELFSRMTQENKRYFIESNNNLSLLLPVIELLFPNYKIVHVIRDPEDYIGSVLGNVQARGYSLYSDDDPRLRPSAKDFHDDPFYNQWEGFSQEQKIAWFWGKYNDEINKQMKGKPQYLQLEFADLFKDESYTTMREMLEFLQIETLLHLDNNALRQYFSKPLNISKKKIESFTTWPASRQEKCRLIFNYFQHKRELNKASG